MSETRVRLDPLDSVTEGAGITTAGGDPGGQPPRLTLESPSVAVELGPAEDRTPGRADVLAAQALAAAAQRYRERIEAAVAGQAVPEHALELEWIAENADS